MRPDQPTRCTALVALLTACSLATGCKDRNPPVPARPVTPAKPAHALALAPPPPPAPAPPPVSTGRLVIVKATWGALYMRSAGRVKNVTKQIRELVRDDSLSIVPTTRNLGEPAPGQTKFLKVVYKKGTLAGQKVVGEREPLTIPVDDKPPPVRLVVSRARYGDFSHRRVLDVTARVADMVEDNALSVSSFNQTFGDPAPGTNKELRVSYKLDGRAGSKTVTEGQVLTLSGKGP